MCAMLALVAPEELQISRARVTRFLDAYIGNSRRLAHINRQIIIFFRIELLTRLRLYTCAAYLRKYCPAEEIRKTTLVCGINPHNQFSVYFRFLCSWKRQSIPHAGNVENLSFCRLAHSAPNR
jgi:hypothetical protein